MDDPLKTLRRARNDFAFAAAMFAATSGSALWIAHAMDEGDRLDLHSRLPQTAEMKDFANYAEKLLLIPCGIFPLLSDLNLHYRRKKYEQARDMAIASNVPGPTPQP